MHRQIHDTAIWRLMSGREGAVFTNPLIRGVSPFHHKVSEGRALDDLGGAELQLERLQLDVPLSNPPRGIGAPGHRLQGYVETTLMGWPWK